MLYCWIWHGMVMEQIGRIDIQSLPCQQGSAVVRKPAVRASTGAIHQEVSTMVASLARRNVRSQALGEHLSVVLIPKVAGDLWRLRRRTRLSTTDLANRAITSYEFFDAQLRAGRDVIVRDNGTGETRLVRFLDAPVGQARGRRPRLFRWGPAASHRRQVVSGR